MVKGIIRIPVTVKGRKLLYRSGLLLSVLFCFIFFHCPLIDPPSVWVHENYPGTKWDRVTAPEKFGWSTKKLETAEKYAESINSAGVFVIFNSFVIADWGNTSYRFPCHSIRESLLNALYGIHVQEGNIDISMTVNELGIDDNPPSLTKEEKQATIQMLLQARSGIYHPAATEIAGGILSLPERNSHEPGTFWFNNNWDLNALGTIFEQETETQIFEEFKMRIAVPLQMEDFRVEDGSYSYNIASNHPVYSFQMSARDMARFGLLFLRKGKWKEEKIIPEDWIFESTKSYSDAGDDGGYGYLWWVSVDGRHLPNVHFKGKVFSARGDGGHYILVLPYLDVVIVHRVNTNIAGNFVSPEEFGTLVKKILDAQIVQ